MESFVIKGIWKGEYLYDDRFQPSVIKTPVPFILKIKSVDDDGLFEGMCQDDPTVSQIESQADVFGKMENDELIFAKRYPRTILKDNFGKIVTTDHLHHDVMYHARISNTPRLFGTWKIERTFRKFGDKVMQLGPVSGVWWMERF